MVTNVISKINTERKNQKLTVKELSKKTSISSKHIYQVLNGKANPSFEVIDKLANALGMKFVLKE